MKTVAVGSYSAEVEGPHGLAVDPDGRHWNVSISHGFLWGSVRKYETGSDACAGASDAPFRGRAWPVGASCSTFMNNPG